MRDRGVRQPDHPRPQQRRGPQIRQRIGEVAQQRHRVLDFVGVEETESFVDVGRDAAAIERRLEIAMAVARAEQDRDVGRPRLARDAGHTIADHRAGQQPHDLVGYRIGRGLNGVADDEADGIIKVRLKPDTTGIATASSVVRSESVERVGGSVSRTVVPASTGNRSLSP